MNFPAIALKFAPCHSEKYPWIILSAGLPAYRLADRDHAVQVLEVFPQLIDDGWKIPAATLKAIEDTATMQFDRWERIE